MGVAMAVVALREVARAAAAMVEEAEEATVVGWAPEMAAETGRGTVAEARAAVRRPRIAYSAYRDTSRRSTNYNRPEAVAAKDVAVVAREEDDARVEEVARRRARGAQTRKP